MKKIIFIFVILSAYILFSVFFKRVYTVTYEPKVGDLAPEMKIEFSGFMLDSQVKDYVSKENEKCVKLIESSYKKYQDENDEATKEVIKNVYKRFLGKTVTVITISNPFIWPNSDINVNKFMTNHKDWIKSYEVYDGTLNLVLLEIDENFDKLKSEAEDLIY